MNSLYIDLVSEYCAFLLIDNKNKQYKDCIIKTNKNMIDIVVNQLDNFLKDNNLDYHKLENIYLNVGPGSFTGVRAGVNIAKTILTIYNHINLYTINTMQTLNHNNGIAILDAKGSKWYIEVRKNNELIKEVFLATNNEKEDIIKEFKDLDVYSSENIDDIKRIKSVVNILNLFDKVEDWIELEPLYVKNAC